MCYSFVFFALSLDLDRESFEANPILLKQNKKKKEHMMKEFYYNSYLLKKRLHRILRMNPKD